MADALIVVPEITKGMKSIGSKALLKIKNSFTILEYQIQQIRKIDKKINIHIVTGFESEKIKKILCKDNRINIVCNDRYLETNQSQCLKIFLQDYSPTSLFVVSNGIIFREKAFDLSDSENSKIFLIDKPKANFTIGCCEGGDSLDYLFYDLPSLWSECVLFNHKAIHGLRNFLNKNSVDQFYIFEIINILVSNNISFQKEYIPKKNIMKINTIKDLTKARVFV